ncbi:MAG: hypothetical protein ACRDWG_04455 [Actinomycetes bacterium]
MAGRSKRRSHSHRRATPPVQLGPVYDDGGDADPDVLGADLPGWPGSPAGVGFATKMVTVALWCAVVAGPVLGLAAFAHDGGSASASDQTVPELRSGTAPAGVASLYLAAWLSAGSGTEETVRAYYPQLGRLPDQPNRHSATRLVPVEVVEVSPGYWSVTVAAQVVTRTERGWVDTGVHYYRVPIRVLGGPEAGGEGKPGGPTGYVATGLPAEVGAPAGLDPVQVDYPRHRPADSADPVADSVGRFLAAYLLGDGELTRYVSPGSALSPISPPPYTGLVLRDLYTDESSSSGRDPDRDGARLAVLATVDATDRYATTRQLSYALTLTSRDGRWEVSALDPAPALATGGEIPLATSTTAP